VISLRNILDKTGVAEDLMFQSATPSALKQQAYGDVHSVLNNSTDSSNLHFAIIYWLHPSSFLGKM
jgi:hypothetical protein